MKRGISLNFLNVLIEWYLKLNAAVRLGNCLSYYFRICSGVRQGRIMSPYCFNCYIDPLIQTLKESDFGCWLRRDYAGCILFADDILLLFASVSISYRVSYLCVVNFQFSGNFRLIAKNVMCVVLVLRCLLHVIWS